VSAQGVPALSMPFASQIPGVSATMKVVGYARVSTDEQATEGVSLDAQAEKIRAYCGLYALDLVAVVTDPGTSAKSLARPGLTCALDLLDTGKACGVVVAKLDRLTRSVADLAELLARYFGDAGGRHLFSVADSIDTRTAAGRLVLNVLTSVAQWERETIVERTRDALRHKRARSERTGAVPYGWDLDLLGPINRQGRPSRLVPNPAEQEVLSLIRRLDDAEIGPRAIAATLTEAGVLTKTGRPSWSHSAVARILARLKRPAS
jgi:site-specific DNA recombinase